MVELTGQGMALVADDLQGVPFLSWRFMLFPYIYGTQISPNSANNLQIGTWQFSGHFTQLSHGRTGESESNVRSKAENWIALTLVERANKGLF